MAAWPVSALAGHTMDPSTWAQLPATVRTVGRSPALAAQRTLSPSQVRVKASTAPSALT